MKKKLFRILVICLVAIFLMTGCGNNNNVIEDDDNYVKAEPTKEIEQEQIDDGNDDIDDDKHDVVPTEVVEPKDPNATYVSSAQEFVDAIAPGAKIVLEEGTYNLSGVFRDRSKVDSHKYLMSSVSGVVITGVDDLSIVGPKDGVAKIVLEEPDESVLYFDDCNHIQISNVTVGHEVMKAVCSGSVILFDNCSDVDMENNDLYGCGTYAVQAFNSCDISVKDSILRECTYGIVSAYNSSAVSFTNCKMKDCEGFEMIDALSSKIEFEDCDFSGNVSDFAFVSDSATSSVVFKSCTFGASETKRINEILGSCVFDDKCKFEGNMLKDIVIVSDVDEFVNAIRPGVTILMKPGVYNLSDYAQEVYDNRLYQWDMSHNYVKIEECYDGVEIVINCVDDMSIYGLGESREDVQLIADPRYANVLKLDYCTSISMANLTAGHTDRGDCEGDVIAIVGGQNFTFDNVDFYGCGVYGISAHERYEGIYVFDSYIHDCEYGPFYLTDGMGSFICIGSQFSDSLGAGLYDIEKLNNVMIRCKFGQLESNKLFFADYIEKIECEFEEITEYPEY